MDVPQLPSETELRDWFRNNQDVELVNLKLGTYPDQQSLLLIYCQGMSDDKQINQVVLPSLQQAFRTFLPENQEQLEASKPLMMNRLTSSNIQRDLTSQVFAGNLLLYFQDLQAMYTVKIAKHPQRAIEEPSTEISNRGARDGFVEELSVNIALIRKRIPTHTLSYEQHVLGTRTNTKLALLYLEDVASPSILEEVRIKLSQIKVDAIYNTSELEGYLTDAKIPLFPLFSYTGRPDFVAMSLVNGRFVLMLDGSSSAIIAPVSLFFLLEGPSDPNTMPIIVSFQRMLRIIGLSIALLLPAFWICLNSYHQDQIPYTMLATIVISRQGVPMSAPLEAFLMIMLFELFREAGLRLPASVGQTLSVVGGLIIGQAAISAGLTSPSMLVVIASSVVASFILGNQDLSGTIRLLNMIMVLISSVFGLFGFFVSVFGLLVYLTNLRSLGVPYLAPASPIVLPDLRRFLVPIPWSRKVKRSEVLTTIDSDKRDKAGDST
ncbi:spore germination protein [Tumebacillus permanentifrigoris]|uniref:GerA spore germination protein n=1 Tax=Tumebacillus permanentifrigoris TaxID=378543 RepID=A0A316DAJ4_9BACL|nr:spore germination protein [Tumebacillus permanentifrigoris]PWK13407.1 GerA spore germination protein [Tumebacillus permanentifrigoris]